MDCGKQAHEYDHRDYDKPLEVEPTCKSCNSKRGPAIGRHDVTEKKHYIYVEVKPSLKRKAIRLAKKADMLLRKWMIQIIKEAK